MKIPNSTTEISDAKDVTASKFGVELLFTHEMFNHLYPPIPKTKKSFLPYFSVVYLSKNIKEPLPFETEFGMSKQQVHDLLGEKPEWKQSGSHYYRHVDIERDIIYSVYAENTSKHALKVKSAEFDL